MTGHMGTYGWLSAAASSPRPSSAAHSAIFAQAKAGHLPQREEGCGADLTKELGLRSGKPRMETRQNPLSHYESQVLSEV